jgi:hypothetical protein
MIKENKNRVFWVIKSPRGWYMWDTISATRKSCIFELEKAHDWESMVSVVSKEKNRDVCWKWLYRRGFRAEQYRVIEVKDKYGLHGLYFG